jgi:hypothetical protein
MLSLELINKSINIGRVLSNKLIPTPIDYK